MYCMYCTLVRSYVHVRCMYVAHMYVVCTLYVRWAFRAANSKCLVHLYDAKNRVKDDTKVQWRYLFVWKFVCIWRFQRIHICQERTANVYLNDSCSWSKIFECAGARLLRDELTTLWMSLFAAHTSADVTAHQRAYFRRTAYITCLS